MAGVVRRDGLREAVTALRDEWRADLDGSGGKVIHDETARYCWDLATRELARVLDAVPDVPPDPPAAEVGTRCNPTHTQADFDAAAQTLADELAEWLHANGYLLSDAFGRLLRHPAWGAHLASVVSRLPADTDTGRGQ